MKLRFLLLVLMLMALLSACIAPVQPSSDAATTNNEQAVEAHGEHEHMTDSSAELGERAIFLFRVHPKHRRNLTTAWHCSIPLSMQLPSNRSTSSASWTRVVPWPTGVWP